MLNITPYNKTTTNDLIIRLALKEDLDKRHSQEEKLRIIEEFGVQHGTARVDLAVINGIMHGYEIKSDRDTLERLSDQAKEFSEIFDMLTLVVGKRHLYQAIHVIPEWWGIIIAKEINKGKVILQTIRDPKQNKMQKEISIARLLWKKEALEILEQRNEANGVRYKPREFVYQRLAQILKDDLSTLKGFVRNALLISRRNWRPAAQQVLNGD